MIFLPWSRLEQLQMTCMYDKQPCDPRSHCFCQYHKVHTQYSIVLAGLQFIHILRWKIEHHRAFLKETPWEIGPCWNNENYLNKLWAGSHKLPHTGLYWQHSQPSTSHLSQPSVTVITDVSSTCTMYIQQQLSHPLHGEPPNFISYYTASTLG